MNLFIFKGRGKSSVGLVQKKGGKKKVAINCRGLFFVRLILAKKVVVVQIVAKNPRRATLIVVAPGTT